MTLKRPLRNAILAAGLCTFAISGAALASGYNNTYRPPVYSPPPRPYSPPPSPYNNTHQNRVEDYKRQDYFRDAQNRVVNEQIRKQNQPGKTW